MFFSYACGTFDFSIYNKYTGTRLMVGVGYSIVVLVMNLLVFINLLIALMQDTYASYADLQRGLFY